MKKTNNNYSSKEELIQKLFELVFEQAKTNSGKSTGLPKYLHRKFEEDLNEDISEMTFERHYKGYITKEKEKNIPQDYTLNSLSKYLGYENFKDFEIKKGCEVINKKLKTRFVFTSICSIVFFLALILFISKYYKKNCMIWVDDHYEKIRCSGLDNEKRLDEVVLNSFEKISICKDSTFFKNGEAIIHYTRHNNVTDFFTSAGEHPIYDGVYTNPITQTIIDSRVKSCDSLIKE